MVLLLGTKGVDGRAGDDAPEKQAGIKNGWEHRWSKGYHHHLISPSAFPQRNAIPDTFYHLSS